MDISKYFKRKNESDSPASADGEADRNKKSRLDGVAEDETNSTPTEPSNPIETPPTPTVSVCEALGKYQPQKSLFQLC